jgi:hypothetical protein
MVKQSFFCSFLSFKAGSELIPVRSAAAKLDALKAFSIENARQGKAMSIFIRSEVKLFLCLFCLSKLEVNFFQCVAVRPTSLLFKNVRLCHSSLFPADTLPSPLSFAFAADWIVGARRIVI